MRQEERENLEQQLQDVPYGSVTTIRHTLPGQEEVLLTGQFSARTKGKGKLDVYQPLPGVEASYSRLIGTEVAVCHEASDTILELFYCRRGRVGWNMRGGISVYLGEGDLSVHSAGCCADSCMMFPLGYAEGLSVSMDLAVLQETFPPVLRDSGVNVQALHQTFCAEKPVAIPASQRLEEIFSPIYSAPSVQRKAYLYLKMQELLLYLSRVRPQKEMLPPYESQQTEMIKEIHRELTTHLEQRLTIEDLARKYLINTSTLKEVFKAVYGQPIGAYMKGYRVEYAMKLLRGTRMSIQEIAERVGYRTPGKFSKAFKDVAQMLPTEYRNHAAGDFFEWEHNLNGAMSGAHESANAGKGANDDAGEYHSDD